MQGGSEIGIVKKSNQVCFENSRDNGFIGSGVPCDLELKHRTAIGIGKADFAKDTADKLRYVVGILLINGNKHGLQPE